MNQPTVRIVNDHREIDGQYYCDPGDERQLARIRRDLAVCQEAEPGSGWHLETRGTSAAWRRWID
jgi:hypothetical protein